jgi:hypothetical protein
MYHPRFGIVADYWLLGTVVACVTIQQANAELQVLWQTVVQRMAAEAPEKGRPGILRQRASVLSAATGFNPLRNDYSDALLEQFHGQEDCEPAAGDLGLQQVEAAAALGNFGH